MVSWMVLRFKLMLTLNWIPPIYPTSSLWSEDVKSMPKALKWVWFFTTLSNVVVNSAYSHMLWAGMPYNVYAVKGHHVKILVYINLSLWSQYLKRQQKANKHDLLLLYIVYCLIQKYVTSKVGRMFYYVELRFALAKLYMWLRNYGLRIKLVLANQN